MSLKADLISQLEENENDFLSGEALAMRLGVSRNAIWKTVNALRSEGFCIEAVTNKGYRLQSRGDVLTALGIESFIKTAGVFFVEVRKSVTSTNTIMRDMAAQGAPEGLVLAAQEQTAGKGRQGRSFHSPAKHGVYFSLILRPGSKSDNASLITSAAAVAAARAIESEIGVSVGIKWVNDLFVGDKKVCGILTEAVFGMESGLIESAVLGIGINVTTPEHGFPGEISNVAAALTDKTAGRNNERVRLIAATLDNFWEFYQNLGAREFLREYRERSIITGRDVSVVSFDEIRAARALEIDDNCGLVVEYENGKRATLNTGEVSIRL